MFVFFLNDTSKSEIFVSTEIQGIVANENFDDVFISSCGNVSSKISKSLLDKLGKIEGWTRIS